MGQKVSFLPHGRHGEVPGLQRRRVRAGDVQGPRADAEEPAHADRGDRDRQPTRSAISRAFIYIRGEYELQADILEAAIAEAAATPGCIGERILGSDHSLSLVLHRGAGAYICGEETGLLDSLEGKRGNPRLKPPFPAIEGLYPGPTLINNVETLCHGPDDHPRWAARSTPRSAPRPPPAPSSCRSRATSSGRATTRSSWGSRRARSSTASPAARDEGREVKFWFPGGSSSPVLTADDLDIPYDFDTMAKAGSMLGSGAIIVVDDTPHGARGRDEARPSSTRTSPAASASPAARGPTGP